MALATRPEPGADLVPRKGQRCGLREDYHAQRSAINDKSLALTLTITLEAKP